MLKLKLQYFGHLMQRADSFEKTLMLGKTEAGWEGSDRGWGGSMASLTMDMSLSKLKSRWTAGKPGVLQSTGLQGVGYDSATEQQNQQSIFIKGLPWWLRGKESACNAGDAGSIPRSERSPGAGNGNPLQYSCLENFMDRGAWWTTVQGVTKSQTWLSTHAQPILYRRKKELILFNNRIKIDPKPQNFSTIADLTYVSNWVGSIFTCTLKI